MHLVKNQITNWGFTPNPTSFFGLNQKTKQKSSRDLTLPSATLSKGRGKSGKKVFAHFTQKTSA